MGGMGAQESELFIAFFRIARQDFLCEAAEGKREKQKKALLSQKEKRRLKSEKRNK